MRSFRRVLAVTLPVLLLACGGDAGDLAANGQAIINGEPDTAHPYVGTIANPQGGGITNNCSGVLISPTVFLTAGHCIFNRVEVPGLQHGEYGVSFDPVFSPAAAFVTGEAYRHPYLDVGVIVLDEPQALGVAALPSSDFLEEEQKAGGLVGQRFTLVGYGATDAGHFVPRRIGVGTRRAATVVFDSLKGTFMHTRQDPAGDLGGGCNQDSGGPYLLEGTTTVVAIVSWGNPNCNGTAFAQRVDLPEVLDFLDGPFPTQP